MTKNNDKLQENQLSLAVKKALKQLLKNIENEPTLIVEIEDRATGGNARSLEDIREWLFKRR